MFPDRLTIEEDILIMAELVDKSKMPLLSRPPLIFKVPALSVNVPVAPIWTSVAVFIPLVCVNSPGPSSAEPPIYSVMADNCPEPLSLYVPLESG